MGPPILGGAMAKQRMTDQEVAEKLASKLEQLVIWKDDGCWQWKGASTRAGYGAYGSRLAHRLVWVYFRGPIPDGLELDHLCRNRACVSPDHLEPVTHSQNVARIPKRISHNAAKTSCKRGHEFSTENTWIAKDGSRHCRTCNRLRAAKYLPGVGVGGYERAKTCCPQGHIYAGDNLYVSPNGKRSCNACRRARGAKLFPGCGAGAAQRAKTCCPQGHSYTPDNTWIEKNGTRHCRTCRREHSRAWYRKSREMLESS